MKTTVITIQPGDSFFRVLLKLSTRANSAWIFVDEVLYQQMVKEVDEFSIDSPKRSTLMWGIRSKYPLAKFVVSYERFTAWREIVEISNFKKISFGHIALDPTEIFFFKGTPPFSQKPCL